MHAPHTIPITQTQIRQHAASWKPSWPIFSEVSFATGLSVRANLTVELGLHRKKSDWTSHYRSPYRGLVLLRLDMMSNSMPSMVLYCISEPYLPSSEWIRKVCSSTASNRRLHAPHAIVSICPRNSNFQRISSFNPVTSGETERCQSRNILMQLTVGSSCVRLIS